MIKVLLIEDHEMVREGTERLLSEAKGIQVVGAASTGHEGLALAREKSPEIVILDFQLPDMNGLEVTRKLLRYDPDIKVLVVTAMKNDTLSARLLDSGVSGYISKEQGYSELEKAIRAIHSGQRYLSPDIASQLALSKTSQKGNASAFDTLSSREMEIVLLLADGMSIENIAKHLFIAKKTVHTYRYRIFEKLKIKSDLELLRLAVQNGIIRIDATDAKD